MKCLEIKIKKDENYNYEEENENYEYEEEQENYESNKVELPYIKKYLLTKNEYYFYGKLKCIAEKYNLQILAKIRLADLVETEKELPYKERGKYFNKIKSKHIDFVLVDNMKVVLLIELDDNSHQKQKRIERDDFLNAVLNKVGYNFIRTYGETISIDEFLSQLIPTA